MSSSEHSQHSTEFREDDPMYLLLTTIHIKYAGIVSGFFGMLAVVTAFGCGIAFFPWAMYETGFDVIGMTGFLIFLISGVCVHWQVLYAINYTKCRHTIPFLMYHCFLIALEAITGLIAIGELVADQTTSVEKSDKAARYVLIVNPILICVECFMVGIMWRVRTYLRNKRRHIRNGLPPPIREVSRGGILAFRNKVFSVPQLPPISASENEEDQPQPPIQEEQKDENEG